MEAWLTGGSWVTADGWGRLGEDKRITFSPGKPVLPKLSSILDRPVNRSGRFDAFTRMGVIAVALAMKDAGWLETPPAEPVGMVVSSKLGVLQTDFDYYRTTLPQSGLLSSPNLFSYTLPVAVLGECASNFRLTGPTYVLGDDESAGRNALEEALLLLEAGDSLKMLAGWIDSSPEAANLLNEPEPLPGAVFVALEAIPQAGRPSFGKVIFDENGISTENGCRIFTPAELINSIPLIR
jgi:3-oxoacyl-[acyl-carrier-protein] synthase II